MDYVPKWRVLNTVVPEIPILSIFPDEIRCVIKRLTEDDINETLDLILGAISKKYDPIISALDFDEDSCTSLTDYIKAHLNQHIAYGCFQVEGPHSTVVKLIAVDALYVRNKRDDFKPSEDSGEAFGNWLTYLKRVESHLWWMGQGKICNFLSSFGVFILEEIRDKFEISKEMMQMRKDVAKALRIKVVGAAFIGKEIQEAVQEDGPSYKNKYKPLHSYKSDDCKKLGLGDISREENLALSTVFPIKIMGLRQNYPSNGVETVINKKGKLCKRKYVNRKNKNCEDCRTNQFSI